MRILPDPIGEAGLQFFGRMSASISHELKNVLAIIKENAGLLNDYLSMMSKGKPIDPERFQTVAQRIDAQTRRADTIIKYLNQFAHTVDNFSQQVDLNQVVDLLTVLHQRPAAQQQVSLSARPADNPVEVTTAPFVLLTALGLGVSFALPAVANGKALTLAVARSDDGGQIIFSGLEGLAGLSTQGFPGDQGDALVTALGAEVKVESEEGRLTFILPRK
jgi:C4-dicarboxylate-specific signal transduction histidine kinase